MTPTWSKESGLRYRRLHTAVRVKPEAARDRQHTAQRCTTSKYNTATASALQVAVAFCTIVRRDAS
jgi:hypothetical protein